MRADVEALLLDYRVAEKTVQKCARDSPALPSFPHLYLGIHLVLLDDWDCELRAHTELTPQLLLLKWFRSQVGKDLGHVRVMENLFPTVLGVCVFVDLTLDGTFVEVCHICPQLIETYGACVDFYYFYKSGPLLYLPRLEVMTMTTTMMMRMRMTLTLQSEETAHLMELSNDRSAFHCVQTQTV